MAKMSSYVQLPTISTSSQDNDDSESFKYVKSLTMPCCQVVYIRIYDVCGL